jgi:hypothetical protein
VAKIKETVRTCSFNPRCDRSPDDMLEDMKEEDESLGLLSESERVAPGYP